MGGIMKKIILILCVIMTTTVVHATQMCARRNTTVIPLDGAVHASTNAYNLSIRNDLENMWGSPFPYGWIYGTSTCLSQPEIKEYKPDWDGKGAVDVLPTDDDEIQGRSGVYYTSDGTEYGRSYCYCKMTHPMSSRWVYQNGHTASNSVQDCITHCNFACYYMLIQATNPNRYRNNLITAIGYDSEEIDGSEYDESINLN